MRRQLCLAAAALALLILTGCGQTITADGLDIDEPDEVLDSALARLKEDNASGIQDRSVSVSEATRCFFVKPNADSEDVSTSVACGPVRRLGVPDDRVWDQYLLTLTQDADGKVTAAVEGVESTASAIDPALLVRSDDERPAPTEDVPAPEAPRTDITDVAAIVDSEAAGDIAFTDVSKPWTIITPAATVTVTATAAPDLLPVGLVVRGEGGDGMPPYFRPAEGQKVLAFRLSIAPGPKAGPPADGTWGNAFVKLDSVFGLGAGGQRLPVDDLTSAGANPDASTDQSTSETFTVRCSSGSWGSTGYPCDRAETTEHVLMASVAAAVEPTLTVSVNGQPQAVDLTDGTFTSAVSQVHYTRADPSQSIQQLLTAGPVTKTVQGSFNDSTYECSWSQSIDDATLSAFDPWRGWAEPGRAWLVIGASGYTTDGSCSYFPTAVTGDVRVKIGSQTITMNAPKEERDNTRLVFAVPDTTTKGRFIWQPRGRTQYVEETSSFEAKAVSIDFTIPK